MLIYPAIDLIDGQAVRLAQGRFEDVTVYDADPLARLRGFAEAGAQWVHVVDLDGARAREPRQHALIGRLARAGPARIQSGGGVRHRDHIAALLDAGVSRVVVGSLAVSDPDTVLDWLDEFGAERLCIAPDVKGTEVAVSGWTQGSGLPIETVLAAYAPGRLRHVLVTDVSVDGLMTGPNLDLYRRLRAQRPDLAIQASGGVGGLQDLAGLRPLGVAGVIVGRALYEGRLNLGEALNAR